MTDEQFTVDEFRKLALESFGFLESKGFRRMQNLEETSPTGGTLVYLGKHVGFVFSLDLRDECVDAQVVKVLGGQFKPNWEGGYSSDIFLHLVKHQGYRGKPVPSRAAGSAGSGTLKKMVDSWADMLKHGGLSLLNDNDHSLQ